LLLGDNAADVTAKILRVGKLRVRGISRLFDETIGHSSLADPVELD
jgi:hypothetical protein